MEVNRPSAFPGCKGPPQAAAVVPGQSCTSLWIKEVTDSRLRLRMCLSLRLHYQGLSLEITSEAPVAWRNIHSGPKTRPQVTKRLNLWTFCVVMSCFGCVCGVYDL